MSEHLKPLGLLTIPQTQERLNLSRQSVYRLFWSGELRRVKIGRAVRVRAEDVLDLIERATVQ